jgi:signal peptidase I
MWNPFRKKQIIENDDDNEEEEEEERKSWKRMIFDFFWDFFKIAAVNAVLLLFVIIPAKVDGFSMKPTMESGNFLFASKVNTWFYSNIDLMKQLNMDYQRGDLIIFSHQDRTLIKRIIAREGDEVLLKDGFVYVNNKRLIEDYLPEGIETRVPGKELRFFDEGKTMTVPPGFFFVLGDNRPDSKDSRYFEVRFVDRKKIVGIPVLRVWPLERLRLGFKGTYTEESMN